MNKQVAQTLQMGAFFTGAVIILDMLLARIPVLEPFALGLVFCLAAASILVSVAHSVPRETLRATAIRHKEQELQDLTVTIDAAIYQRDKKSLKILSEELRSLALGTIAGQTRLPKKEILELATNEPESLQAIVRDERIMKLLARNGPFAGGVSEKELEGMLSEILSWSS
jgi:hypothetical protein